MSEVKLPDKLSDLLELAIKDCMRVSRRKNHALEMGTWLRITDDGKSCSACMAGAVMLCELKETEQKLREERYVCPGDYSDDVERKLLAINYLRSGDLQMAVFSINKGRVGDRLQIEVRSKVNDNWLESYERASWKTYREVVYLLRENGL